MKSLEKSPSNTVSFTWQEFMFATGTSEIRLEQKSIVRDRRALGFYFSSLLSCLRQRFWFDCERCRGHLCLFGTSNSELCWSTGRLGALFTQWLYVAGP